MLCVGNGRLVACCPLMDNTVGRDVLSPEQIYEDLRTTLGGAVGVDEQVFNVVRDELLHVGVDAKESSRAALEKLLNLAKTRATEVYE